MANDIKKSTESPIVEPVQNGEVVETTIDAVGDRDGEYKRSFSARHIHVSETGQSTLPC